MRFYFLLIVLLLLAMLRACSGTEAASTVKEPDFGEDPPVAHRFNAAELDVLTEAARVDNTMNYPTVGTVLHPVGNGYILPQFKIVIATNGLTPWGACDSDEDCATETDPLCMEHNGSHSDPDTADVQTNPATGDQACSADCTGGGTAVIACNRAIIDEPDPAGYDFGGNRDVEATP